MKEYLKMADGFDGMEVSVASGIRERLMSGGGEVLGTFVSPAVAKYAAHAINSHDELVKRLAVMTELVGKMNCYCHMSGLSAKANSENPVESWMAGADEALDAIRSAV